MEPQTIGETISDEKLRQHQQSQEPTAELQQAAVDIGTKIGRGWPLTPNESSLQRLIQSGVYDVPNPDTLTVSQTYAMYVEENQPRIQIDQVEQHKRGELPAEELQSLTYAIGMKVGRTGHLDPVEQLLVNDLRSSSEPASQQLVEEFLSRVNTFQQSSPDSALTPYQAPSWQQSTVEPFGFTVGTTESPDQLSDASFRYGQTIEFRFNPISHETPLTNFGGSDIENLKIGEQLEAAHFELLLPAEYEQIRGYLQNDGYLSNEEISVALFDASLTQEELQHKVDVVASQETPDEVKEKVSHYLWEIHQSLMGSPLLSGLDSKTPYELVAIEHRPVSEDVANHLHKNALSESENEQTKRTANTDEDGLLTNVLKLKTFQGGLLANLLHNYEIAQKLIEVIVPIKSQEEKNKTEEKNNIMEAPELAPRFTWDQIAEDAKRYGISKDTLQESGNLSDLLHGRRTGVIQLEQNDGTGTMTPVSGKLYITEVPKEGPRLFLQAEQEEIRLPKTFLGHELTPEDKKNLLSGKEMGRAVDLIDKISGESFKGYIGLDTEVNKLTVLRQDRFHMPAMIKGVPLSHQERADLRDGKTISLKGMMGYNNQPFDGDVRISAVKRSLEFKRAPEQAQKQTVTQQVTQPTDPKLANKQQTEEKTPKKQQEPKANQEADLKKNVAVVTKNGQSRTSVDSTKGSTTKGETKDVKAGKIQKEATVNGQSVGKKEKPKKEKKSKGVKL